MEERADRWVLPSVDELKVLMKERGAGLCFKLLSDTVLALVLFVEGLDDCETAAI